MTGTEAPDTWIPDHTIGDGNGIENHDTGTPYTLHLAHPLGWYQARIRWDGCVEFTRVFNIGYPSEDADHLHICDIDDMIDRLQQLKAMAQDHFGKDWPE